MLSVTEAVWVSSGDQLERSERLRQSVFQQAFSCNLVAQDPNDEPASVLLERIRAKRAQQAASK